MSKPIQTATITPATRTGTIFVLRFEPGQAHPWGWMRVKTPAEFRYELVGTDWGGEGGSLR